MYIFSRIMTVSKTMRPSKQTRIFSNISSSHSSLKQVLVFIRSSSIAIFGPNSIKPNEECVILGITYFQTRTQVLELGPRDGSLLCSSLI